MQQNPNEQQQTAALPQPDRLVNDKFTPQLYLNAVPMIITNLFSQIQMIFSVYFQLFYFPYDAISDNLVQFCAFQIISVQLPQSFCYNISGTLLKLQISEQLDDRKQLLASYYNMAIIYPIFIILAVVTWSSVQIKLFHVTDTFKVSYILHNVFGSLFTLLNGAQTQKYLMEQRILLAFTRQLLTAFTQLAIEQFLYFNSLQSEISNNNFTFIAYVVTNFLMSFWQLFILLGGTMYGFQIRNVSELKIMDVLKFSKAKLKLAGQILLLSMPKFCIDLTLPLSVLLSFNSIQATFTDDLLKYFAIVDLYIFYVILGLIASVSNAFSRAQFLIQSAAFSFDKKRLQKEIPIKTIIHSIIVSLVVSLPFFVFGRQLCLVFLPIEVNTWLEDYMNPNSPSGQFDFALILGCILYTLDSIPQVVGNVLVITGEYTQIFIQAMFKIIVMIVSIQTISSDIGDKANFLYVVLFTEGTSILISVFQQILIEIKFQLVTKKLMPKESKKSKK